jgi:hypothetical protein
LTADCSVALHNVAMCRTVLILEGLRQLVADTSKTQFAGDGSRCVASKVELKRRKNLSRSLALKCYVISQQGEQFFHLQMLTGMLELE